MSAFLEEKVIAVPSMTTLSSGAGRRAEGGVYPIDPLAEPASSLPIALENASCVTRERLAPLLWNARLVENGKARHV
jgi:hypothetical protein